MTEAEEIKYLKGKVQGLDRLCAVLANSAQKLWDDDLVTGLEWRLGIRTLLRELIADLKTDTPFLRGQREALAEFESHFFNR